MIHHYINLVCWREMLDIYDSQRDVVWVDTFSLHKLVKIWHKNVQYRPGTSILERIGPESSQDAPHWFFLTAHQIDGIPLENQYCLPVFRDEIVLPASLAKCLEGLAPGVHVGIGISAPKQNYLATALHRLRPDLEYHCLGAAIQGYYTENGQNPRKSILTGSGFEWIRFFWMYPARTWNKIECTLRELWLLQTQKKSRDAFRKFASICMPSQA
ncbi:hypothetical protein [Yoonia sp. 2307UL14-13]|uniref:hypothetical protein n=1 Tax=Yoonia sp. 2307UL14-13 TaxID=3126506 RepID=UPI0030EDD2F1